jgi:hypothetical protein
MSCDLELNRNIMDFSNEKRLLRMFVKSGNKLGDLIFE